MTDQRRFAPMGLWTLTGCGKPWTASKSSPKPAAHRFPRALGKPAHERRFSTSAHRPRQRDDHFSGGIAQIDRLNA